MFGPVNALFSGMALAGIIWAIVLQKRELELQRQELKSTTKALEGQREELEKQNLSFKHQRIENTFFQLLKLHNDVISSFQFQVGKKNLVKCPHCHKFAESYDHNYCTACSVKLHHALYKGTDRFADADTTSVISFVRYIALGRRQ